jgi:NDP-sugar pyrophosphorylase family protein
MNFSAILAGGEGSRLTGLTSFKPLLKINGIPLLEYQLKRLLIVTSQKCTVLLNEKGQKENLNCVPSLANNQVHYFFKSPPSSLHSLYEVSKKTSVKSADHLFITMVDTIIKEEDFKKFTDFCKTLPTNQSAVLTTSYIEDEKPLTVEVDQNNNITKFQIPVNDARLITSGMYYLSGTLLNSLERCLAEGTSKMRNFLAWAIVNGHPIKSFEVEKTLDIDRPEDLTSAMDFLSHD